MLKLILIFFALAALTLQNALADGGGFFSQNSERSKMLLLGICMVTWLCCRRH